MTNCCICDSNKQSIIVKIENAGQNADFYLCDRECLLIFAVNELGENDEWCLADIEDLVSENYKSDTKLYVRDDEK